MRVFRFAASLLSFLSLAETGFAQQVATQIQVNQVGFYPSGEKIAVLVAPKSEVFLVKNAATGKVVFRGKAGAERTNQHSGKKSRVADFSALKTTGKFFIELPDGIKSPAFEVKAKVHRDVAQAAIKAFYYQRASMPLEEKFAGQWARPAGHPDDRVLVHASAASKDRPEGTVIHSARGWYDAGDYNKYIVNSGITMGTLLSLYEDHPEYFEDFHLNIPESNNRLPDLLDEVLYNLRWMLTMQDPADGGVYHKLTNPRFDKMVMPAEATGPRYAVQKATPATLDFVAVMAQSARVFAGFKDVLPGLSDSCMVAAVKGWEWAQKNPDVLYQQEKMNEQFEPDVVTGAYGDRDGSDEKQWAAAELFATTGKPGYLDFVKRPAAAITLPTWNQVSALAYYTLVRTTEERKTEVSVIQPVRQAITGYADELLKELADQPYHTVMGKTAKDYAWGSSSVAANQGIALLYAYRLTGDKRYRHAALGNLDYLLGRNATGYSFLTGFGSKRVMHPHHRPSIADGIADPIPGLLSGGPNPGQQDKCATYTSKFADESFTDDDCSYASNEIAINWNAPMVYLAAAIEATEAAKASQR